MLVVKIRPNGLQKSKSVKRAVSQLFRERSLGDMQCEAHPSYYLFLVFALRLKKTDINLICIMSRYNPEKAEVDKATKRESMISIIWPMQNSGARHDTHQYPQMFSHGYPNTDCKNGH